jgi:hypothetical protein
MAFQGPFYGTFSRVAVCFLDALLYRLNLSLWCGFGLFLEGINEYLLRTWVFCKKL